MEGLTRGRSGYGGRGREEKEAPRERRKEGEAGGGGWEGGEEVEGGGAGPGSGGGMRARWTSCRALRGESALKGEALRGRFLLGAEPRKESGGVCARPSLLEASVFGSGGWKGRHPARRLSAFRPGKERLGPKKVTQAPLGTLRALGPSGSPGPPRVPRFPGHAGPRWAGLLGPRAVSARP